MTLLVHSYILGETREREERGERREERGERERDEGGRGERREGGNKFAAVCLRKIPLKVQEVSDLSPRPDEGTCGLVLV